MISVKGMTWGTPKFVEIAKKAERDAEERELIDRALGDLEIADLTWQNYDRARDWAADIFELSRGDGE